MTLNGRPDTTGLVVAGSTNTVAAAPVAADGTSAFGRWPDGGPRQRTVVMPGADLTLEADYAGPIDQRYASDAALRERLGPPVGDEQGDANLRWRTYEQGHLYRTPADGVTAVYGPVYEGFLRLGAHEGFGLPENQVWPTAGGRGEFAHFQGDRSIYWSPSTGAHEIRGAIRAEWGRLGWEDGLLGYPITDELPAPGGVGRYNAFSRNDGIISVSWGTGAHVVRGAISQRWQATGREAGPTGFPETNEFPTGDSGGRFNHFSRNASIYWSPSTGAWEVYGAIRARWAQLGWQRSYLGYPTSGEYAIPGGRRSNFEHGYITFDFRTGALTDRRY